MTKTFKLIYILIALALFFILVNVSVNTVESVPPGGSCSEDAQCEWDVYGDGDSDYNGHTHGHGIEIWHRESKCTLGTCSLVDEDEEELLKDCSDLNQDSCNTHAYRTYYSVTENGEVCCEPKDVLLEYCDGPDSFCVVVDGEAMCQSNPVIYDLESTDLSSEDYCNGIDSFYLSWKYHSDTDDDPEEFTLQIKEEDDTFEDGEERIYDGDIMDGDNKVTVSIIDYIDYNTSYDWRVMAEDVYGNESDWSYSHFEIGEERANVDFEWLPERPYLKEAVHFENKTVETVEIESWKWEFPKAVPEYSTEEDPDPVEFIDGYEEREIVLEATDVDGVTCSAEKTLRPRPELPTWREVFY